jgi:hypothetical protein
MTLDDHTRRLVQDQIAMRDSPCACKDGRNRRSHPHG